MKEYSLTALTGSRYTTDNWRHWILRRDIIKTLTKEQFSNLLEYKLACQDHLDETWETWYFELVIDTKTSIKLEISSILLNSWKQDNIPQEEIIEPDTNQKNTDTSEDYGKIYIRKWDMIKIGWRNAIFQDDYPVEAPNELITEIINIKNEGLSMHSQIIDVTISGESYSVNASSFIIEN